jgi:large conductance mechanosensitive channel
MGFVKEFKEFAMKGNVMDMAVGVIIGGAFGKIVTSLVEDVIMPLVSLATGGVDFSNLFVRFGQIPADVPAHLHNNYAALKEAGVSMFAYGAFIQNIIDFLIIALCIFFMIKAMNKITRKKKEEEPAPEPSAEEKLLTEIRDLLKKE